MRLKGKTSILFYIITIIPLFIVIKYLFKIWNNFATTGIATEVPIRLSSILSIALLLFSFTILKRQKLNKYCRLLIPFSIWIVFVSVSGIMQGYQVGVCFDVIISQFLIILVSITFYLFFNSRPYLFNKYLYLVVIFILLSAFIVNRIQFSNYSRDGLSGQFYSYFVIVLLPLIFLIDKKWLKLLMILLCVFTIVLSLKRGGIIAVFSGYIVASIINLDKRWKYNLIKYLLFFFILLFFYQIINKYIGNTLSGRLSIDAMASDGGSGRIDIYSIIIKALFESDFSHFCFGHGVAATVNLSTFNAQAHNDFLEVLYDFGLLGLMLYLLPLFQLIKSVLIMKKNKSTYLFSFVFALIMFIILSSISFVLYVKLNMLFVMEFSILLSLEESRREELLDNSITG